MLAAEAFSSQTFVCRYPRPIALAYRRYCQQDSPPEQLRHLLNVFEATLKFLTYVGVSDLLSCFASGKPPTERFTNHKAFQFLRESTNMTLGRWVEALRETARELGQCEQRVVLELPVTLKAGGYVDSALFGPLTEHRNWSAHPKGSLPPSSSECRELVTELRPKLVELLQRVSFLRAYPLAFAEWLFFADEAELHVQNTYRCIGVPGSSDEPLVIESQQRLEPNHLFIVSPHQPRLLYLWPLMAERIADQTQRPTLYGFETISGSPGRFLTRLEWAAFDHRDIWEEELNGEPQDDHAWLFRRLAELPSTVDMPEDLRDLADRLQSPTNDVLLGHKLGPY